MRESRAGSRTGQQGQCPCGAGSIPARFIIWEADTRENTHCVKIGSGHASYKACGRSTSFPGSRLFKVKSGSGSAERTSYKMTEAKMRNAVEYKKSVTTDDPDAYAEAVLKFEGMSEERTGKLREMFNKFYKEVEAIMYEDAAAKNFGKQPQREKEMRYRDGKPYFAED